MPGKFIILNLCHMLMATSIRLFQKIDNLFVGRVTNCFLANYLYHDITRLNICIFMLSKNVLIFMSSQSLVTQLVVHVEENNYG